MASNELGTRPADGGPAASAPPGGSLPGGSLLHDGPVDGEAVDRPPLPPVRRTPSMRPALIVLGLAVLIVVLFGVLAAVAPGNGAPPATSRPSKVKGSSLLAVSAEKALQPIEHPGTPPADIVGTLTLPQGATARGHQDVNASTTQYDEQMTFSVGATQASVVGFYKAELKTGGWSLFSVGPATDHPDEVEVLAQKGGSDGWYWEVGAVVSPTTFSRTGAGETTAFTLKLFQEPDDD